jgi:hypothetical protein
MGFFRFVWEEKRLELLVWVGSQIAACAVSYSLVNLIGG